MMYKELTNLLILHAANLGLIFGTKFDPLSPAGLTLSSEIGASPEHCQVCPQAPVEKNEQNGY